ncbi:MAG: polyhydroxyalkanoate synthesis regulator DNA-binding domain-containing protein [Bryobacteraceae bacterium]
MNPQKPKIVIKKYENRRLYDSAHSRYVNLEEIAAIIREGHDVQVVDAKTGEDVTRTILTQIIVDESRGKDSGLPLDLLKQIIVSTEQARHQFLDWYFKSAIDTFQRMQDQMRGFQGSAPAANPLDSMMNLFRGVPGSVPFFPWSGFQGMAPAAPSSTAPQQTPPPAETKGPEQGAGVDVAELQRRLEELERQVAAKSPKRSKKS